MRYPHLITIQRPTAVVDPTPGNQNQDTGLWTGDTSAADDLDTVWEGRCDCQDLGTVINRDEAGTPTLVSDATCFLQKERAVDLVKVNDMVTITWEDQTTSDARVLKKVRLDGSLLLKRLENG